MQPSLFPAPAPQTFTVSKLTFFIRKLLEEDEVLQDVWVQGEISNLSRPASGHVYFTLKDSNASLKGVMWKTSAVRLEIALRDGMGPVVSQIQFDKIQGLIQAGIDEGATLVCGGPGRPENLNRGYYVRPTVFGNVSNDMTIAREEIFGPVLSVIPYESEDDAVEIANDTPYGLAAYVQAGDIQNARRVAARLRAGSIYVNNPDWDTFAPFGGYKQSGNGREYADWAIHDFLEIKGIVGYGD
jgi:acyl-CoA reductase-like NAD-dependent aldehyde dehydrogenase